jgi:NADH dehydrogenase [ubiquinone] 1 alpha subcomplex assembly factor 7
VVGLCHAESESYSVNALGQRIARLIEAQGPLSVAQFMTMALHDPQGGYYATRDPFGTQGDFITAPEISQMFGELLGLWIVQCWHDQGKPSPARLVELGPGRGTLMADALRAARLVPEFLAAIEVVMVENSAALAAVQKETLKVSPAKIRWAAQFDDTLTDRPLFLLANEFFDALPIRQFVKTQKGWCERMIGLDDTGALAFALAPEPSAITTPRADAPSGAFYETSPSSTALTEQIARAIAHKGGAALIMDYGYGADAGFGETLQAVSDHKFAPVLERPGEVDLTAHVDFAALADAALSGSGVVFGPQIQGDFLTGIGIIQRAERLILAQPKPRSNRALQLQTDLQRQRDRLILPDQMGTLFKALAILPKGAPVPPGF